MDLLTKAKAITLIFKTFMTAQVGIATTFYAHGDPWNPVAYAACLHRDLRDTDLIVAHPTLPCGSKVWLYNLRTNRSAVATIGDRGPRHAMVDLSKAVARVLRSNGYERMLMVPMGEP